MMLPLRVEYLANPRYGLNLSVGAIVLLTSVVPNISRLLMTQVWGRLFDWMNFFLLRIILNGGFALGILAFFTGNSMMGLVLGSLIFGVSTAGGDVAWSLWGDKNRATTSSGSIHVCSYFFYRPSRSDCPFSCFSSRHLLFHSYNGCYLRGHDCCGIDSFDSRNEVGKEKTDGYGAVN